MCFKCFRRKDKQGGWGGYTKSIKRLDQLCERGFRRVSSFDIVCGDEIVRNADFIYLINTLKEKI